MSAHWALDDIDWQKFDRSRVDPSLVKVVKAAALVEHNGADYTVYLKNVFHDDEDFRHAAEVWGREEIQHGQALARWAAMADPDFSFEKAFSRFTAGYGLPLDASESVRGSRTGELIARCIVETGTSSYYTALAAATDEPVLKQICRKIAADELRHYKLFYDHMRRYQKAEKLAFPKRFRIALGRIVEAEDDELSFAYHAANNPQDSAYDRKICAQEYLGRVYRFYSRETTNRAVAMVMKAIGMKPQGLLHRLFTGLMWGVIRNKARQFKEHAAQV